MFGSNFHIAQNHLNLFIIIYNSFFLKKKLRQIWHPHQLWHGLSINDGDDIVRKIFLPHKTIPTKWCQSYNRVSHFVLLSKKNKSA